MTAQPTFNDATTHQFDPEDGWCFSHRLFCSQAPTDSLPSDSDGAVGGEAETHIPVPQSDPTAETALRKMYPLDEVVTEAKAANPVAETAELVVSSSTDRPAKTRNRRRKPKPESRSGEVKTITVRPDIWEAAQACVRPGEHLKIVSAVEVITEYD